MQSVTTDPFFRSVTWMKLVEANFSEAVFNGFFSVRELCELTWWDKRTWLHLKGNLQRDAPDSATGRGPLVWEAPFFGVVEGVHMIDAGLMRDWWRWWWSMVAMRVQKSLETSSSRAPAGWRGRTSQAHETHGSLQQVACLKNWAKMGEGQQWKFCKEGSLRLFCFFGFGGSRWICNREANFLNELVMFGVALSLHLQGSPSCCYWHGGRCRRRRCGRWQCRGMAWYEGNVLNQNGVVEV